MSTSYERLLQAARDLRGWGSASEAASGFALEGYQVSPQTMTNWASRGVSKEGLIECAKILRCRIDWLREGVGPMAYEMPATYERAGQDSVLQQPFAPYLPDTIMVSGEEKLIVLGYRKLSEGMRQVWLQAAKDAVEKEAEPVVDRKKQA